MEDIKRFETTLTNFSDVNNGFIRATVNIFTKDQVANGFEFQDEGIEKRRKQWAYVPVVAEYIEDNEDMGTHGGKLTISDGEFKYERTTIPMGVAIADTDRFEDVICMNGETKRYFCTDVYLWYEQFEKELSMFKNGETRPQSMEVKILNSDFVDGVEKVYDFEPLAICILGQDVPPAFKDSKVKVAFQSDEFKANFDKMMFALDKYIKSNEEGGNEVEEENKNTEVETDVESVETDVPSTEEVNMDESIKDEETTNVSDEEDMKKKKKCEDEDNREAKSFELSHDDVRNLLSKKLDTYDSNGRRNYDIWVMEVFDTYCIYQKWDEVNQYFKAYYTKTENDINIEDTVEVFMMYLTQQELDDLKQEKESYSELQSKYNDVNEKYQKYVKKEEDAKKQEMIDSFAGNLTQEEVEKCIDDISKFTVEEIETKLTLELGRKAKSEKQEVVFTETNEEQKEFVNFAKFDDNSYFAQLAKKIKGIK